MKLVDADLIADCLRDEIAKNEDDKSVTGMLAKGVLKYLIGLMEDLPAAQPEIIRCKDCAKHEYCRTSTVWAIPPKDDWYCADAERRTDG